MNRSLSTVLGGVTGDVRKRWLVVGIVGLVLVGITLGVVGVTASASSGVSDSQSGDLQAFSVDHETTEEPGPAVINDTINLSDARTKINGTMANESVGQTVAHVGNISGNETNDVALGVPSGGENNTGAVHLFFGPTAEGELNVTDANLTLTGISPGDWAGYDVTAADLTGDGLQDLVVGAPAAGANGTVYVFYGDDLQEYIDTENDHTDRTAEEHEARTNVSLANASVTIAGGEGAALFGHAVSAHGYNVSADEMDADRDAEQEVERDDDRPEAFLAIGAPWSNETAGAVYVFDDFEPMTEDDDFDADADDFRNLTDTTANLTGENAGDLAGWSVAAIDNHTGDGEPVLAVGAPGREMADEDTFGEGTAGENAGAVYVLTNLTTDATLAEANLTLEGQMANERAGWSVADASDLNADGRNDLIVGAPFSNATGNFSAGAAYVHLGDSHEEGVLNLSEVDRTLVGEAPDDLAGWSVAGSTALTCDEYGAVLVGAPSIWQAHNATGEPAGTAYLAHGAELFAESDEQVEVEAVSLAHARATFIGENLGDEAGFSVAAPGDVTGNNAGDVLVGAPGHNQSHGAAYVIEGECPVEEPVAEPADDAFFDVEIVNKNDPVAAGETLEVTARVTNTGDDADRQDIRLEIDHEHVDVAPGVELGPGESETVTLTWETGSDDAGEHTVMVYSQDDRDKQKVTISEPPERDAFFAIEITDKNDPIEAGETLEVTTEVTNTGDEEDEQRVYLKINGERVATSEEIHLEPDESQTVRLTWQTDSADVGEHRVQVFTKDDRDSQKITVRERPAEGDFFDVEIVEKNDPIEVGETLEVTTQITNTGDQAGTQDIRLEINGERVDVTSGVELEPGESETVTLRWTTGHGDAGDHKVMVHSEDDNDGQKVAVERTRIAEEPFFDVEITDKNDPVEAGETLVVDASVTNTGDEADTQNIWLRVSGERIDVVEDVSLEPGETRDVTLRWETSDEDIGEHRVEVYSHDDRAKQMVNVTEPPVREAFFDVEIVEKNDPVTAGETLTVTANINNTGGQAARQDIRLSIDNRVVDHQGIELEPGESDTVSLQWHTSDRDVGKHMVTVYSADDSDKQAITVEERVVEESFFDVENLEKNDPVTAGETLTVDALINNTGEASDTQDVRLVITDEDDTEVYNASEPLTLDPSESETVPFEWENSEAAPGNYTATVTTDDDALSQDFEVREERVVDAAFFEVVDLIKNDPITVGETLTVDANISNIGTATGTQDVELRITDEDDQLVHSDSWELTLDPSQSGIFYFEWDSEDAEAGNYTATVSTDDDSLSQVFQIREEPPENGTIEGMVTDNETGEPIVGANVTAEDVETATDGILTTTDGDGNYSLEVEAGTYNVTAEADIYDPETAEDVRVNASETVTQNFTLDLMNGTIEGNVTDNETGEPIVEANVTAEDVELITDGVEMTTDGIETTTDGDGNYTLDVEAGTYNVTAEADGYELEMAEDVEVGPGENVTLNFTLDRIETTGTIEGTVTDDQTGEPIVGATVEANGIQTTTDGDGTYTLEVEAGNYDVTVDADGYELETAEDVQVSAGETVTQNFALEAEVTTGTIEGTVTDSQTGEPIVGATVDVNGIQTTTDGDGDYALAIEQGTYDVTVDADGYDLETADNVEVTAGEAVVQNFELQPIPPSVDSVTVTASPSEFIVGPPGQTSTITATVEDSNGDPIEGIEVAFSHDGAGGLSAATATTDQNGQATVTYTTAGPDNNDEIEVTASANGVSGSTTITVGTPNGPPGSISATGLSDESADVDSENENEQTAMVIPR